MLGGGYEGEWVQDKRHGQGKLVLPSGNVYKGDFVNGAMHGLGIMVYVKGGKYEGEWAQDEKNGKGKLIFPTGGTYEGEFVDGKMHGQGIMRHPSGSVEKGYFENNKFVGKDGDHKQSNSPRQSSPREGNRSAAGSVSVDRGSYCSGRTTGTERSRRPPNDFDSPTNHKL